METYRSIWIFLFKRTLFYHSLHNYNSLTSKPYPLQSKLYFIFIEFHCFYDYMEDQTIFLEKYSQLVYCLVMYTELHQEYESKKKLLDYKASIRKILNQSTTRTATITQSSCSYNPQESLENTPSVQQCSDVSSSCTTVTIFQRNYIVIIRNIIISIFSITKFLGEWFNILCALYQAK